MVDSEKIFKYTNDVKKDRILSALKGQEVDRVPNMEILIEDKHVEKFLGRYAGNTLATGGDPAKGEVGDHIRPMFPNDFIDLCLIIGQDAMIFDAGLLTPFSKEDKNGNLVPVLDKSVKDRKEFNSLVLESEKQINKAVKYVREYKAAVKERGVDIAVAPLYGSFYQTLYEFVIGMHDFMIMAYEDRGFIEDALEVSAEHYTRLTEAVVKAGADFIFVGDDVAFKTGLFLPPDLFKKIWVPRYARVIEPAVNAGLPIMFHSDGKIDDIIEDLIEMGVDCINPMDPSGVDYRDYKKRFGNDLSLSGNVNVELLANGSPEEIENDVKEHMEVLKPGYGYIAACSHSIVNYIPHENVIAYFDSIHRYGEYV